MTLLLAGNAAPNTPRRPPAGVGTAECDGVAPSLACRDADAMGDPRPLLFYQVLAACGAGGDQEGAY